MRNWKIMFKATAIRYIKTFCQTAVAMLPVSLSIIEDDWLTVIGTAALAAIASLLKSLVGLLEEEL